MPSFLALSERLPVMPEPGKTITPAGTISSTVVALEGRGLAVADPVGLESDLRYLAAIGPAGGGFFGAFWRAAMEKHHVRMLGERPWR